MSSYQARRQRRKWHAKYVALLVSMRERIDVVERAAAERVGRAEHALARINYDRPVRWDAPMPVAFEREIKEVPNIAMRLLGCRKVIDRRMLRYLIDAKRDRFIEEETALDLARAMVREGMVCMDQAEEPTRPGEDVVEYDWSVYVGKAVRRAPGKPLFASGAR